MYSKVLIFKTTGPKSFEGLIGNKIGNELTQAKLVEFTPVQCEIEILEEIIKDLSNDQKYLYEVCVGVKSGTISKELALKSPGSLHYGRWLIRANRILRLYVSTTNAEKILQDLIKIILKVFAPGWFRIKSLPKDGAINFYYLISLIRNQREEHRIIMENVLRDNACFAHPENILIPMITDRKVEIRKTAVDRIINARTRRRPVRNFDLPNDINFNVNAYTELIYWNKVTVTSPPLFKL